MNWRKQKVTVFKDVRETLDAFFIDLEKALDRIKTGTSKDKIEKIRGGNKKEKSNLPCVLFSGVFDTKVESVNTDTGEISYSKRNDASLTKHSRIVVLDFDKVDAIALKAKLKLDPFILSCWVSPSGDGVKALIKIDNSTRHKEHYNAIIADYSKYGDIDSTSRNVSRVCYESYDPAIYVNWESWVYSSILEDKVEKSHNSGRRGLISVVDYSKLKVPVKLIEIAEDGEKHNQLCKASYLLGGYVSAGYVDKDVATLALEKAISSRDNVEDLVAAKKTIEKAMSQGENAPIYEFSREEGNLLKEVGESVLDFISDFDSATFQLMEYLNGNVPMSFSTGWKTLDENFVWKPSSFHVNLGHDNVGKTYVSFSLAVSAAVNHGWKFIIYSAENKMHSQVRDLMQMSAQKLVSEMTQIEFKFYNHFVREHFEFIDNTKIHSYSEILSMANKILKRKHYDYLIIDPYNALSRKDLKNFGGTHDYDNEAAANMLSWANYGGTGILLNVHTNTEAKRRRNNEGYVKKPFKDDGEGGGKWSNKADVFTITHRTTNHKDKTERSITEFSVEKIRDAYTGGQAHSYDNPFRMKLMYSSYFVDVNSGSRSFTPLKPNLSEY